MSESRVLREGESPPVYELVTSPADFEMVATALDKKTARPLKVAFDITPGRGSGS